MDEVEEIVDDFVAPGFGSLRFDQRFGEAIEEDDGQGEPNPPKTGWEFHRQVTKGFRLQMVSAKTPAGRAKLASLRMSTVSRNDAVAERLGRFHAPLGMTTWHP